MSWYVEFAGRPEEIVAQLEEESNRQSGQCKKEYDAAKPHLIGLVGLNFGEPDRQVHLVALGSGYYDYTNDAEGKALSNSVTVKLTEHDPLI